MTREEKKVWHEIVAPLMKIQADIEIVIVSINRMMDISPDELPHISQGLPYICNIGPIKLNRAAEAIKGMIYTPEDDQVSTAPPQVPMVGETNRNPSIWVCSGCFTVITNMEYEHVNKDGCCKECGNALYQYEEVDLNIYKEVKETWTREKDHD